jgi:hypothetical protein
VALRNVTDQHGLTIEQRRRIVLDGEEIVLLYEPARMPRAGPVADDEELFTPDSVLDCFGIVRSVLCGTVALSSALFALSLFSDSR